MLEKTNTLLINRLKLLVQTIHKKDYEISEILVSKIYALKNIDDDLDAALEDVMYGDYEVALKRLLDYIYMQKLWNWADKNNISNAKLSREKSVLLKTKILDLTSLKLDNIPNEITCLTNLEELILCNCGLNFLPKDIVKLTNLKKLDLRDNPNLTFTEKQKMWLKNIAPDFKDYNKPQKKVKTKNKTRIHEIAKKLNLSSKEVISQAQKLWFQVTTAMSTLSKEDADKLIKTIHRKDKTKEIQNDVTLYDDKELSKLKKELKALESKFQTLIEQRTEYLNNIEEFNREYNLHLGDHIRTILNLKKEILYKKTIKQQKEKEKYNENKQIFEETQETIDELKNSINELEETLESIDESNESYDEIKSVYEELQSELKNLENELELQEEELEKTREFIEDEDIEEEYEEVKSQYDEYDREYNHIKEEQNTKIDISEDEKKELKKLYKKAARLCHPDIVPDELKEKANEMMQQLNDAYSEQDLNQVKKVLNSLENGIEFELSSETIEDKELLKEKIKEYKENIKNIKSEIDDIKEDEAYTTIASLDDWDEYFKEVENELKKEIKRLEDEAKEVSRKKKTEKTIIQKEYKTPYAKHILSIQNPNFERIRRYCNNLVNENKAGKMQEFLAQNGKMYKALLYDTLEQFLAKLEGEDITLVDWGCDQGIASMLVRDYIKEKQLNIKVSQVILIDSNKAKLSRAMTQIEAVAQDEIKIIALKSDDNKLSDTIKTCKNNTTLNLFANDKMPIDFLDIDYDIFEKDYFICVSNKNKEFVDEVYGNFNSFINVQDVSIRDGKIGRYHKYERIFRTIENYIPEVDEYGIPF